jgi:hypothetical protein
MKDDTYNVKSYSDNELYDILDLVNPSDRELEAKILHMVWKYENIGNESGVRLVNFFREIYDHFFEEGNDTEIVEGFEVEGAIDPSKIKATNITSEIDKTINTSNAIAGTNNNVQLGYSFPLDYTKDSLNPLLKQTTKRIVSIDSQYRAIGKTQSGLSSHFTFNLSAPLKDVVNLKLYSVQIPYTWYTINDSYGSNFFYLKGNVPGIDNGYHDIKVAIGIGNYTAPDLITAVNAAISNLKTLPEYSDMLFNDSKITYDSASSKATLDLNFQKRYDESYYLMSFSGWTTPRSNINSLGIDSTNRGLSIPAFLGFDFANYKPYRLISTVDTLPWPPDTGDSNISNYELDASNNYITIVHYSPTTILETITIRLTLALSNRHSRDTIMANLNKHINESPKLFNSSLQRLETTSISGKSHYALDIRLDRTKTKNEPNSKVRIIFNESATINQIWTGSNSAFCFENITNELNTITSKVRTVQRKIDINSSPVMYFKCLTPFFNGKDANGNPINSTDLSLNDFQITIPNAVYTLNGYINTINNLLYATGNVNRPPQTNGVSIETISINALSFMDFKMDIQKKFETGNFNVDMSDTFLSDTLKLTSAVTDLAITHTFTGTFPISGAGYTINKNLMKLTPKPGTPNRHVPFYIIPGDGKTYADIQDLRSGLLGIFTNHKDDLDGNSFMSDTTVSIIQNGNNATITLTINVKKILSELSYKVSFIDASANSIWSIDDPTNSWAYNLKIKDSSFNWFDYNVLGTPYSNYPSETQLFVDTITLTPLNNTIRFDPVLINDEGEGIYTPTMNNSVIITLPVKEYSRDVLFAEINRQLSLNPITTGTVFSGVTIGTVDYTQIKFNINKIYNPSDYRVVFYDPFSFVTCNAGSSSVRNTTWDSTLGWILGFRASTEYNMSDLLYFVDSAYPKKATVTGDNVVSISIYNYFMIVLDDYNQSHMNSGIITTTQSDTDIPLPAYTNRALIQCDPITKMPITSITSSSGANLTRSSIYAQQAIADDKVAVKNSKKYSSGPFTKDVFALVPLKISGLPNNSVYVADGGTLQNQERTYFGPVNISRMTVKLVNDRGELVNLNGANWSFSFICEQLYKQ